MSLKIFVTLVALGAVIHEAASIDFPLPLVKWNKGAQFQKTGVACESHKLYLKCPNRSQKLVIYNTFYGRKADNVCQHQILPYHGKCAEDEELINKKIMQLCANENRCSIAASRDFLLQNGKEKCPHLYKYLTVQYKCVQTPHIYKKCFHKKCVAPAKCWPQCSRSCCEPPPAPRKPLWSDEQLASFRKAWSAPEYQVEEFPTPNQELASKRYNIPGTYLYGMQNTAQTAGYARSSLNYPKTSRNNYGYYSAYAKSNIPSQEGEFQIPGYQLTEEQKAYYKTYAARSKVQTPSYQSSQYWPNAQQAQA